MRTIKKHWGVGFGTIMLIMLLGSMLTCGGGGGNGNGGGNGGPTIISSFSTTPYTTEPQGIEIKGSSIFVARGENPYYTVYEFDMNGNYIGSYPTSNSCPREIDWDGTYFWHADACIFRIQKYDNSFTFISSFSTPYDAPRSVTYDTSRGTLWATFFNRSYIYEMNTSGSLTGNSILIPGTFTEAPGLKYVSGNFWVSTHEGKIYKLDYSGNVLASFNSLASQPNGIAWDGTYLWIADSSTDMVYQILP